MLNLIEKFLYLLIDAIAQMYLYLRQFFYSTAFNPPTKQENADTAVIYVHGLFGFPQQFSPLHEMYVIGDILADPYALNVVFDMDEDIKALSVLYDNVKERGYGSVVFVGHSRGCVVIAKFLAGLEVKKNIRFIEIAPATKDAYLVELYRYTHDSLPKFNEWVVNPLIQCCGLKPALDEFLALKEIISQGSEKVYADFDTIAQPMRHKETKQEFSVKATHMSVLASPSSLHAIVKNSFCVEGQRGLHIIV